jgi:hypothetical protein
MWVVIVIAALTVGLVAIGVLIDNRQLRRDTRDLRADLNAARTEATDLKTDRELIEAELRAHRDSVESLSAQVAELKQRIEPKPTPAATRQQAFRIPIYLDNRQLSQGWLLPGRTSTNAAGQTVYEPVVVLDPSARTALTSSAAKPAQASTPASVTVNHNYPGWYDNVWPGVWFVADNQKHRKHGPSDGDSSRFPMQPQPQPLPASPFLSTRIWQPQTGFQQMARGRPGGEWISSAPRGHSYLSSGGRSAAPLRN